MEINETAARLMAAPMQVEAPPPATQDGRATADVAAKARNPHPEVPLPIPASPSQSGLVGKAALSDKEAAPKLDTSGVSSAERMLKPYGINMLPEKQDAPKQEMPDEV